MSLPIFTIHGNHDYPNEDFGQVGSCDLLEKANYLNYFGRHMNQDKILIKPLIITKKGCRSKLALYGLGYIKDYTLNNMFDKNRI